MLHLTTCGQHRTLGYTVVDGVWVCRGCGLPQHQHETSEQTVARHRDEAVTA
jgi:hypothetical protein